jgi:hypothetical protein
VKFFARIVFLCPLLVWGEHIVLAASHASELRQHGCFNFQEICRQICGQLLDERRNELRK